MYEENIDEKDNDKILFDKFKENVSKLCEKHPEIIEYKCFRKKLEKLNSFEDLK